MYELIQVSDKSYYIQSPAKIGLVKPTDVTGRIGLVTGQCPYNNAAMEGFTGKRQRSRSCAV